MNPGDADVYANLGGAYSKYGQHQRAIQDYTEDIRLKPDHAWAYGSRGYAYSQLGRHQRAIQDFNEYIRLKPDDAKGYDRRGATYMLTGNNREGCRSLITACELGECKNYELSKQKGNCQ